MCGLAGYFASRTETAAAHQVAVGRMIGPITHRGPDDSGTWVDAECGVALGFRRLAIIDLSARGHQPMPSASGRFMMVFNGEVYNFGDLRRELEGSGAVFLGHSDSEVMLAAFEQWGVEPALKRFVGMFAIALWDRQDRVLHLARDRFGKKPLFVYAAPGIISFGSELKSLVAGPRFDGTVDHDAVAAYLRYMYVPAPQTIYRHVQKLMPGHLVSIKSPDLTIPESTAFWSAEDVARHGVANPFQGTDEEGVAELERVLSDAARIRMVADVPLGAFLSGGIDSSTVVALMQAGSTRPIRTFSVGFDEPEFDEASDAARVAAHLGTDHSTIRLTGDDALSLVPSLPEWFDEPLADPSQLPTYLICREARREVTVAISGDGGDELFGGYNRYRFGESVIGPASRTPRVLRGLAAGAISAFPAATWDRWHQRARGLLPHSARQRLPGEKLHKLSQLLRENSPAGMYRSLMSAVQQPETLVLAARARTGVLERILSDQGPFSLLDRMMLADQLGYLTDDLLAKVDRVSMAVSLEVRVPLLDHRVAEFAWSLPRRFKIRDGETKWALRQILYRHVPRALVERPKMGFSVPIDRWLRGPLREWAEDLVSDDSLRGSGLLDPTATRAVWRDFLGGSGASGLAVWTVVNLLAWQRRWRPTA